MAAESDQFVVATFAIWAGDFRYYENLLGEFAPPHRVPHIEDEIDEPEDILRDTGARRLRQFRCKKGEFGRLVSQYRVQNIEISDQPPVVETAHLRGTIWRVGDREFVMQAYLKDLSWEESLFSRARDQAERLGTPRNPRPKEMTVERADKVFGPESFHSRGRSWVVTGNPFIQIQLTELGLLEARSIWVERSLPAESDFIIAPFLRILESLDQQALDGGGLTRDGNSRPPK